MYTTCIHCNSPLGTNEMLERFPVGRRIAYDQATGRLWAVCRSCERWNLSPLETRWEAIEDAERLFRATPLKVSGENIGMAQTTEGLELVRIGAPPKVEMAAWRYGDQFGKRRRRHFVVASGATALAVGFGAVSLVGKTGIGLAVAGFSALNFAFNMRLLFQRGAQVRLYLRNSEGKPVRLDRTNARVAALVPGGDQSWRLTFPHQVQIGKPGKGAVSYSFTALTGPAAHEALSRILPYLNRDGGSRRRIADAVDVIAGSRSTDQLIRIASTNTEAKSWYYKLKEGESNIGVLPGRIRLALEMALHDDDERRAMEGELARLEARWREADALAKIADSLLMPEAVEGEIERLRSDSDRST